MPLVISVTLTPEKVTMPLFQAVLNNEGLDGYQWFVEAIEKARIKLQIPPPSVVVMDGDQELISAIAQVWPHAQRQRCIFHLSNNMILNIKKYWKRPIYNLFDSSDDDDVNNEAIEPLDDEDDLSLLAGLQQQRDGESTAMRFTKVPDEVTNTRAGLFLLWQHMLYSQSKDHYDQAWALLQRQFKSSQGRIVNYIINNLIPIKEEWAGCWIRTYLNFGQRTTSPNESSNAAVKSYGLSARMQFEDLFVVIDRWIDDRYTHFYEGIAKSATRVRIDYLNQAWMGDCNNQISCTALDLLNQQHQRFLGSLSNPLHRGGHPLPPCTGHTARQYGLVCAHEMARRHKAKEDVLVRAADIHIYWHLRKKRFDDAIMTIRSPPKAVPKGRPRGVGGPFGAEEALPEPPGPISASQTGIPASGRRSYSSWERSGPGLEALDAQDDASGPGSSLPTQGSQSSVPGIELGTPVLSSNAGITNPGISSSPATPAPTTARKRAGADPPGQGGRSVMPGRRRG
jgi:hypothetical protein